MTQHDKIIKYQDIFEGKASSDLVSFGAHNIIRQDYESLLMFAPLKHLKEDQQIAEHIRCWERRSTGQRQMPKNKQVRSFDGSRSEG